jgi:hypothetical protein
MPTEAYALCPVVPHMRARKAINVSAELSPIVRAKIPANYLFRAVHSQILFFLLPTNVGNSSICATSGFSS